MRALWRVEAKSLTEKREKSAILQMRVAVIETAGSPNFTLYFRLSSELRASTSANRKKANCFTVNSDCGNYKRRDIDWHRSNHTESRGNWWLLDPVRFGAKTNPDTRCRGGKEAAGWIMDGCLQRPNSHCDGPQGELVTQFCRDT